MSDEIFTHEQYLSPMTWRYGSAAMRAAWSEAGKRRTWRRIWVALATVQAEVGLVRAEQVDDLRAHQDDVDLARAHALEAELKHDLMAEVHTYAEQCPVGGGIIHLGATSMDVEDNADALRLAHALDLVIGRLRRVLGGFLDQVEAWADTPSMAFTHLQPAEPTTIGYRLAQHAQDLATDLDDVERMRAELRGKGFKGAVGTSASYEELLHGTGIDSFELERRILVQIGLEPFEVATQTAPRKQEFRILSALASLGQTLYKFAADLRILQSPPLGEWAEPFGAKQIGSSAMPFKRNPINAENMDSLARLLAALPRVAWDNAAHSYLERTLDDSANRRFVLPDAFLLADELLVRAERLITGLRVDEVAAQRLMRTYGPFAATERLLMETARRGADRQVMHEVIREHAMVAWAALRTGADNPLVEALVVDPRVLAHATTDEARSWLDASGYVGAAPARARRLVATVRARLAAGEAS
ncbi:MAG: adenylosuccinate lyase [Alphaproteobacteria bacterium]|nr:adenylosuccinate lyase [Alphaproteobacteria bacterium]